MKIKIIYIISNVNKALAFEWIADEINSTRFELEFILLNPGSSILEDELNRRKIKVTRVTYRSKKDLPFATFKIYRLLRKSKPYAVHCHLFEAGLIGLYAAKKAGVKHRIYTRHHSTFHHVYHPKAVKYDKKINAWATRIIAISENVKKILINEGVETSKIKPVHHGFKLKEFESVSQERINILKKKYELLNKCSPVVGVISRFTHWKGIQYIIPAFEKLLQNFPNAVLVLGNAKGDYKNEIIKLLNKIPKNNYRIIEFEPDVCALYKCFNLFVHTPIDEHCEAFGQTYIEALAANLPCVFTLSGIACDFIINDVNAKVVPYKDDNSIYKSLVYLLNNKNEADTMVNAGHQMVFEMFELGNMITNLGNIYSE